MCQEWTRIHTLGLREKLGVFACNVPVENTLLSGLVGALGATEGLLACVSQ